MLDFWRSDGHPQAKWGHFPSCKCNRLQILFSYNVLVRTKKTKSLSADTFYGLKIYLNAFAAGAPPGSCWAYYRIITNYSVISVAILYYYSKLQHKNSTILSYSNEP